MVRTELLITPTSKSLGFVAILRGKEKKKTLTLGESAACRELQNYQQDLTEWGGGGSLLNLTWGLPRSLVSLPSSGGPSVVPF